MQNGIDKVSCKLLKQFAVEIIADLLTDICDESTNTKEAYVLTTIKPFLSKTVPSISMHNFLERIVKYTKIETNTLILILIYIDRLCDKQKFRLNYFNIHKIILAAMLVAIKYNEDEFYDNMFYSKVGGVSKKEICKLEYEITTLINFEFFVSEELFNKYNEYIQSVIINKDDENENEN